MKLQLFKRQPVIEETIASFLNLMSETGILFHEGVKAFILNDKTGFAEKHQRIIQHEQAADKLRREIETQIYRKNLIPESSSDVLALLEKLDNIINQLGYATIRFEIETPVIPNDIKQNFEHIAYTSMQSVEALVLSSRSFFKNLPLTQDNLHKVSFWESEGDKAVSTLLRMIFGKEELDLAQKMHLRSIANAVNIVSDMAEDAADMLNLFVIKHSF